MTTSPTSFPLDRRTRRNADVRPVTAAEFLGDEFPRLAARHGHLVARGIYTLKPPPLAIEVGADSWTLTSDGATIAFDRGVADDALVVTLTEEQFSDWAQDQRSFNAMVVGRELQYRNGGEYELSIWDSLWRSLLDGWPVVDDIEFRDRDGRPLDFDRIFTPDDDPADVAHFLREAGFLHLRGWVNPERVAIISDEIDRAVPHYSEGDGRSWWAKLTDGSHRCVRIQEFLEYSPTTAEVLQSEHWNQLRRTLAAGDELVQGRPGNKVIEALIKLVGVVAGASDPTFHRDCHFGRHAYGCSGVDVGIAVTASSPENGQLQVVAGSHRVLIPVEVAKTAPYLPVVAVTTEPGDCTVHLSCTLHEATPPRIETRKVMYAPFKLAPRPDDIERPPEGSALRERVYKILLEEENAAAMNAG